MQLCWWMISLLASSGTGTAFLRPELAQAGLGRTWFMVSSPVPACVRGPVGYSTHSASWKHAGGTLTVNVLINSCQSSSNMHLRVPLIVPVVKSSVLNLQCLPGVQTHLYTKCRHLDTERVRRLEQNSGKFTLAIASCSDCPWWFPNTDTRSQNVAPL